MTRLTALLPHGTDLDLGRLATWAPVIFAVLLVAWLVWRERGVPWIGDEEADEPAPRRPPPILQPAPSTAPDLDALRCLDGRRPS